MPELNAQSESTIPSDLDTNRLAGGAFTVLFGRVFGRLFDLLTQVVLARFLGPTIFGLYVIGYSLQRIVGWFSSLGLEQAAIHFGSPYWEKEPEKLDAIISQALTIAILIGAMLSSIFLIMAPSLANHIYENAQLTNVIRWFSLILPLVAGVRVAAAATRISLRMRYAVLIEDLVQPISNFVLVMIFLAFEYLFWGSIYAYLLSYIFAFGVGIIFLRKMFRPSLGSVISAPVSIKAMVDFSFPASLSGIFITLVIWMDRFAVGVLLPPSDAGIYQSASQLALLFAIMLSAIGTIFAPILAGIIASGRTERIAELYKVSTKWAFYIGIPIFSVMVIFADEMMNTIYGQAYIGGAVALIILAIGQLINLATGPVGPLLVMSGYQKEWFRITILFLMFDIGALILLIPIFGIIGAAITTSVSIFGVYAVGVLQVRKSLHISPYDGRFTKAVVILLTILTVLGITKRLVIVDHDWMLLLLGAFLAISIFVLMIRIIGWDTEDQEVVLLLRKRLLNRGASSVRSKE